MPITSQALLSSKYSVVKKTEGGGEKSHHHGGCTLLVDTGHKVSFFTADLPHEN